MRSKKGFTLIELLVVIAIIAILAALLFPLMTRARDAANTAVCTSNLRQVGMAIQMYCDSNNGFCPPVGNIWTVGNTQVIGHPTWYKMNLFKLLQPYVKNTGVFKCKAKPSQEIWPSYLGTSSAPQIWSIDGGMWNWTTYTATCWPRGFQDSGSQYWETPLCDSVANVLNLESFNYRSMKTGETTEMPDYANKAMFGAVKRKTVLIACTSGGWKFWGGRYPNDHCPGNHGGGEKTVVLFADNHVQIVPWNVVGWF